MAHIQRLGNGGVDMYLFCIRKSNVLLCARGHVRVPTIRSPVAARCVSMCRFEPASCNRHTPVTDDTRRRLAVSSNSWLLRVNIRRSACTESNPTAWKPCRAHANPPLLRGGDVRTADVRTPLSSGARGLCSGKPQQQPQETAAASKRNDAQDSSVHIPGHGLFKFKELHENPWTVPNLLCVCRIVLAPFLGYLIIQQYFHLSLALFTLAGATDLLDGYIARTWPNQKSALGSALDPLADKILISVLYVSLTYAELIPAPLTALVIFRDIGLIAAVFWVRYKTVPPPVTLSKFFNPCYTTAQLKPTLFSKVNTAIQLLLVAASIAAPVFKYTDSLLLQSLWYITAVTTAASGYSYWHYGRKTVQVLNTKSQ